MDYKIIATGSRGNCVTIHGDVMIDAGLPMSKIRNDLYDVKYLLITHIHQDHLQLSTMKKIVQEFPTITIIGNYEVHQVFNVNIIANEGFDIVTPDYTFTPFKCLHNVLCYGFCWTNAEGQEIIYATDTASLEHAPVKKYDYFFLESNHDESKLEAVRGKVTNGYDPYLSGKRHLSTQQAKAFFYTHRRSPEAEFIELHQSTRFY